MTMAVVQVGQEKSLMPIIWEQALPCVALALSSEMQPSNTMEHPRLQSTTADVRE